MLRPSGGHRFNVSEKQCRQKSVNLSPEGEETHQETERKRSERPQGSLQRLQVLTLIDIDI